jgi:hypothetical protein
VTYTYSTVPSIEGEDALGRDDRVSLYGLQPADALRGLLMTREIEDSPEEAASARQSAREYEEGALDCLADDESVSADIDSES